jgi:hypothetical protein
MNMPREGLKRKARRTEDFRSEDLQLKARRRESAAKLAGTPKEENKE